MIAAKKLTASFPALAISLLSVGPLSVSVAALADDTPPSSAPPADGAGGRHHDPTWAACKKQADDQKLQPGDVRKEFMRSCVKAAKSAPPAT